LPLPPRCLKLLRCWKEEMGLQEMGGHEKILRNWTPIGHENLCGTSAIQSSCKPLNFQVCACVCVCLSMCFVLCVCVVDVCM
jgi:hypothetical protein